MKKVVILAAGQGKRMGAAMPKVLVKIKGRPMIEYLVRAVIKSGIDHHPIIVVSPDNKELIKQALRKYNCRYAVQAKQLGTGHALACAKKAIGQKAEHVFCFYGDHPFIKATTIRRIGYSHNGVITMMTAAIKDFKGWRKNFYHWGRVLRNYGHIKAIVEFKDADEKIRRVREVNPAIYCFNAKWLWRHIDKLKNDNVQQEYYLTDLIKQAFKEGERVESFPIDPEEAMGINTKEELAIAKKIV
jgi:bifunctional UDP-N-acetylglucosamine pyrophosphorylase/glucosamine-1-phosphate N-acetyltransferase